MVNAFAPLALACLSAGTPAAPHSAHPVLDRLLALAGSWKMVDAAGEGTDLRASYHVLAGASAVMEVLFADTPEETVTLYHLEGRRVTVTHLTGRAIPTRLIRRDSREPDVLRFEPTDPVEEGQLLALQLTLVDEEHVRIEWALAVEDGDPLLEAIELEREAPVAELAAEVARLRVSLESLQKELDRRIRREVLVRQKGAEDKIRLETVTSATGPGWNVSGVPFRVYLYEQSKPFATTFAGEGDKGHTLAHYGFQAGPDCSLRFSVIGGHGYIALVEEAKAPPRRIRDIPEFSEKLLGGEYGPVIHRIVGKRWEQPRAVEWNLAAFTGKPLRLYVVDAVSNHYGQIGISEVTISEEAPK